MKDEELDLIDARDASDYDGADAVRQIHELTAEIRRQRKHLGAFYRSLNPVWMKICERELVNDPIPPDAMLFTFMGSGASDNSTVGDFLAAWKDE